MRVAVVVLALLQSAGPAMPVEPIAAILAAFRTRPLVALAVDEGRSDVRRYGLHEDAARPSSTGGIEA